ncbi:MAG: DUF4138 domain-containing protein [Allomuricauda sp.]|jgi:hypothetical protein|uniref:DUF4138 domain-containing protein n=1 Tax=Maribacter flavus TaxID=1658664 RepID=A0ABU7IKC7_9FLAO|nr:MULTISPECIES: DUF4138 domain-containing protein [Flavobacteriaceae]MDC6406296.1 DUF4138 domain-containing protein [Maribacter sp. PR66]MEE1973416.1 DUF4138 domain-containing protein [Maribacter flavus]NDV17728.1 DUF4138 domain-containing protein [Muricauda sp. TY007]USD24667.1 conjugative transposon protein TraN [Allomuricauda aquimarina]
MKIRILIPLLALANVLNAQEVLDTIYANGHKNVALFFSEPIRQGIVGAPNFVFSYNREKEQHFGLVQAKPGEESNLLVLTKDGRVYSYILKYRKQLSRLNHFVTGSESIGTERPITIRKEEQEDEELDSIAKRREYFERFCNYLLKAKNERLATKRKGRIKLQLQKMAYNGNETYLVMQVSNNSNIDFEVDYLKVYSVTGNKKKKASHQRLERLPIHRYQMPSLVKKGESKRFVYVLPKFVLAKGEYSEMELHEGKGSRKVLLRDP